MAGYDGGLSAAPRFLDERAENPVYMPMMSMQSLTAFALPVMSPPVFLAPVAAPMGIDIATEVQRLIETESFKPLSLSATGLEMLMEVAARLSSSSERVLDASMMSLEQVLRLHPDLVSVWEQDEFGLMVSVPQSPWLGANAKPPEEHGVPKGKPQKGNREQVLNGILRGKALDIIEDLTVVPDLQESLCDIASILLASPDRTMLVSSLGNRISNKTRNFLRCAKLRTAQLLRCFADDFVLEEKGAGTTVTYTKAAPEQFYVTQQQHQRIDFARHSRLLKLAADVTMDFRQAKDFSATDLINAVCTSGTNGLMIVDCRTEAEQSISALPGAIQLYNVTAEYLKEARLVVALLGWEGLKDTGAAVDRAYCCIGCRSAEWCQELSGSIIADKLHYLRGGIAAWLHEGGQLIQPSTGLPCRLVHCWSWELSAFFPTRGCTLHCPEIAAPQFLEPENSPERSLLRASHVRSQRLRKVAWEAEHMQLLRSVRLRYCPSVLCLDAEDIIRSIRHEEEVGRSTGYVFVDVRTPEEVEVSTISSPGCPTIFKDAFLKMVSNATAESLNGYTFILFCTVGGRSGRICQELLTDPEKFGATKVVSRRSIAGWAHAKGGLVDSMGQPTLRISPWCQATLRNPRNI
ncbi:unnamed protein product [Cladocopium goreaui]|uniref:Rhodanese domain-containing protein n=1 Tax=Cladocopium goreaui TaxID=2562237 RepID=A0A9P1GJ62_9DINO|nr:unnamed protein product [Cladocopium goreaui]